MRFEKPTESNPKSRLHELFIAGGIGGFACWFFSYPQDIIKTKLQTQHKGGINAKVLYPKYQLANGYKIPDGGMINCAKEISGQHGARGFFYGFSACGTRAITSNAFMFLSYEYAQA